MALEYNVRIADVLKDFLPELPGAIRSVAEREFNLTLREFFSKSYAWVERIENISPNTGKTPTQVFKVGDNNVQVVAFLRVLYGNDTDGYRELIPLAGAPDSDATGSPMYYYITSNADELQPYPYMEATDTNVLKVDAALMPAEALDSTTKHWPRQLVSKYYDAIADGFLARMYSHPNKPYSAPMVAAQKRHNFLRAIGYYAAQRKTGYNGSQNWGFPKGWR